MGHALLRLGFLISLVFSVSSALAADLPSERADLLPQPGRWQAYPSDVGEVKIDRQGRAWFRLNKFDRVEHVQQQVERNFNLKAPWVMAHILLFDSVGRIWISPSPNLLLGYDPNTHQWIRHETLKTIRPGQGDVTSAHMMSGPAFEDRSGRLFFGEGSGCHMFEKGQWTYQPFYELNLDKGLFEGSNAKFGPPIFAPDPAGDRIYAWAPWFTSSGTLGFWIFEDGQWRQTHMDCGNREGRISALIPLENHRVVICPQMSPIFIEAIPSSREQQGDHFANDIQSLNAASFVERASAQRRLTDLGAPALPKLKQALQAANSPDVQVRLARVIESIEKTSGTLTIDGYSIEDARLWGYDQKKNAVIWAPKARTPSGQTADKKCWLISPHGDVSLAPEAITKFAPHVMFADAQRGLFMAHASDLGLLSDGAVTLLSDRSQGIFESFDGMDADGRFYLRTRKQTFALDPGGRDLRRALPVETYALDRTAVFCKDSAGHTIASLPRKGPLVLSRFEHGHWSDLPAPAGARLAANWMYLQPLHDQGLAGREAGTDKFYLFDGAAWTRYSGLQQFVERNYLSLVDAIDNQSCGFEMGSELRLDAKKNIWCADWERAAVFDGTHWAEWRPPGGSRYGPGHVRQCVPFADGQRVILLCDAALVPARLEAGAVQTEAPLPLQGPYNETSQIHSDALGRAMFAGVFETALIVDGKSTRVLKDGAVPRFEDTSGRIWFVDGRKHKLVIESISGTRVEVLDDAVFSDSMIVEEEPGSYWVNTSRGLRHFIQKSDPGPITAEGAYYEKDIPNGSLRRMWIDSERSLWMSDGARLCRVELP